MSLAFTPAPRATPRANGSRTRGYPRLTVAFPDDLFEELVERARADRTTVGEQVRLLVIWGLESAKEAL